MRGEQGGERAEWERDPAKVRPILWDGEEHQQASPPHLCSFQERGDIQRRGWRVMGKKKISLYDSQAPICPICQVLLRPGELQEHMETEIERLANICLRYVCSHSGSYSVQPLSSPSLRLSLLSPFDTVNKQQEPLAQGWSSHSRNPQGEEKLTFLSFVIGSTKVTTVPKDEA
ncbi:E3 ubiquitin-protein ligase [Takifugu flavidus]|uniref:E3 ubiquitin-protein ligase n=1 Tax=Takifugu flavidus TaxID=433684 RepID=A0A5C6P1P4_9TELE|nr:E3 ubiquitin-protein ligase [Takifugu flavidus]